MKKYIILLIIPLLFFSVGCDKDEENNNIISISDYPESILGHWKDNQSKVDTVITHYLTDPVFGTVNSEIIYNSSIVYNYPRLTNFETLVNYNFDGYWVFRYDNSYQSLAYCVDEDNVKWEYGQTYDSDEDGRYSDIYYSINGKNLVLTYEIEEGFSVGGNTGSITYEYEIEYMSDTEMLLTWQRHDTVSVSSNEYTITRREVERRVERVEELPSQ